MAQEDFERLHKFLFKTDDFSNITDDFREVIEEEWPELAQKLSRSGCTDRYDCNGRYGRPACIDMPAALGTKRRRAN